MAANRCGNCHRALTDPASIAIGYGPECRGKMRKRGWRFPMRLVGKLTPPQADGEAKTPKKVKQ